MAEEKPMKAILVVLITALVCSLMVSMAAVYLRPMQQAWDDLERISVIAQISGLLAADSEPSDLAVITAYRELVPGLVDLETGRFDDNLDPLEFIGRINPDELQQSVAIASELDSARIGARPRWVTVYRVQDNTGLHRLILPIYGQGMWSTIRGYLALEADLNTIADVVFYELAETAGIGDRITRPEWLARWRGKKLYDDDGVLRLDIGAASAAGQYQVDGIAGATMTVTGVANLVRYWLGPDGFGTFLQLQSQELAP